MAVSTRTAFAWARRHADELGAAVFALLWPTGTVSGPVPSGRPHLAAFALCGLLMTVPFAWRRRYPAPVAVTVFGSGALFSWLVGHDLPIAFVVASLVAAYSLGAHATGRTSWVTVVGVLVAVGITNVRSNDAGVAGLILTPVAFVAVPWAVGSLVRRLRAERGALQKLTAQLEREQEELARASVAEERARIARELHDIVAHSISVMVVQAGAAEQFVDPDGPARAPLTAIRTTGQQALVEMRRLLGILRTENGSSVALAPQPGLDSLDILVDAARQSGLDVATTVLGAAARIPLGVDVAAYRLVQESFSNVRKHARARRVDLTLSYTLTCLTIEVVDDGVGAAGGRGVDGHGLIGMQERVALYGGQLHCGPQAEGGWQVRAQLPLTG